MRAIPKTAMTEQLHGTAVSTFKKYQEMAPGNSSLRYLLHYELTSLFLSNLGGALGYLLRKWAYRRLLGQAGSAIIIGRGVVFRSPGDIRFGARVSIDDNCLLDAKSSDNQGIELSDDVLVARNTIIQTKGGSIRLGNRCSIGSQCQLSSVGGIEIGDTVMIGGQCYIGGGRYLTDDREIPMMDQGLYTNGPVRIDSDAWIGAGVIIQDGVHIGRGCVIGSGAVIREDMPDFTTVAPHHRLVMLPRGQK